MSDDIHRSQAQRLAALFSLELPAHAIWEPGDLAAILAHQLSAPLFFDMRRLPDGETPSPRAPAATAFGPGLSSFGELLHHAHPPLELLTLTKDFAKTSDSRPDFPLPSPIATVLYYAAIAAALVRHGARITSLEDEAMLTGMEWALQKAWIDPQTASLFREALTKLTAEE